MFGSSLQVRLPRRITAYFLLFGLAALVWLSFGAVYVARSVTDSRSESASLRWLGRGCDRVVLELPPRQESGPAADRGRDSRRAARITAPWSRRSGEYLLAFEPGH